MLETISAISGGLGILNSLMAKDPDKENMERFRQYQTRVDAQTNRALAAQTQWKGFYDDAAQQLAPRLQFAGQQAALSANTGAMRAQANLRRSLGAGGEAIGEAIGAGLQTGANLQQASLRSLAESDLIGASQRMAQARAGLIMSAPNPAPPMYTGAKSQQVTSTFGNLATTLGAYASSKKDDGGDDYAE